MSQTVKPSAPSNDRASCGETCARSSSPERSCMARAFSSGTILKMIRPIFGAPA